MEKQGCGIWMRDRSRTEAEYVWRIPMMVTRNRNKIRAKNGRIQVDTGTIIRNKFYLNFPIRFCIVCTRVPLISTFLSKLPSISLCISDKKTNSELVYYQTRRIYLVDSRSPARYFFASAQPTARSLIVHPAPQSYHGSPAQRIRLEDHRDSIVD